MKYFINRGNIFNKAVDLPYDHKTNKAFKLYTQIWLVNWYVNAHWVCVCIVYSAICNGSSKTKPC